MLDYVDAIVFGGGGDLDPAHFEGESHDTNYFVDHERDVFELELMRAALERRTPVLAICRGMQVLNVVRGGGLHAHLPDALGLWLLLLLHRRVVDLEEVVAAALIDLFGHEQRKLIQLQVSCFLALCREVKSLHFGEQRVLRSWTGHLEVAPAYVQMCV